MNSLQSYTEMKKSLDRLNKFLNMDVLEVFTSWIGGEVAIIKPRLENDQKADHIVLAIRAKEIHLAKDQMAYLAEQIQWKTPIRERAMEFNGHTIHYFRLKGFFQLFFGGCSNDLNALIIHFWVIMSFLVILLPHSPR